MDQNGSRGTRFGRRRGPSMKQNGVFALSSCKGQSEARTLEGGHPPGGGGPPFFEGRGGQKDPRDPFWGGPRSFWRISDHFSTSGPILVPFSCDFGRGRHLGTLGGGFLVVLVVFFRLFGDFFRLFARNERKPETASNQPGPTASEMPARDPQETATASAPLEGGSPSQPGQLRPDSVQPCWRTGGRHLCIPGRSSFCPPIFVLDYLGLSLQKASVVAL